MERYQPSQALQSMFSLLTEVSTASWNAHRWDADVGDFEQTNQFLAAVEPWRAVCSDEDAQAAFFYSIEALRYVAFFLQPFMPGTSARLHAELGLSSSSWDEMKLGALAGKASFPLGQRSALFPRVEGL